MACSRVTLARIDAAAIDAQFAVSPDHAENCEPRYLGTVFPSTSASAGTIRAAKRPGSWCEQGRAQEVRPSFLILFHGGEEAIPKATASTHIRYQTASRAFSLAVSFLESSRPGRYQLRVQNHAAAAYTGPASGPLPAFVDRRPQ
jgi:hypothetical protein